MRLPEVYVKGNNVGSSFSRDCRKGNVWLTQALQQIKYLRVPDEIIDIVKEQQQQQHRGRQGGSTQRQDHPARGGHGGDRGRGGRGRGGATRGGRGGARGS